LEGVCVLGVVEEVPAGFADDKLAIGVDGSVALDHPDLIHDVVSVVGAIGVVFGVLVVGVVVDWLLVHVDAVEVDGLHLLLRRQQLTLALALHPVVVVVFVRRVHLLAAARLLRSSDAGQQRIGGYFGVDNCGVV
jgi:hypothetical protein